MNSELLAYLFKLIIIPMGFFMIWAQDKFTWTLYHKYYELWEKLGAPGGFFWCPEGRGLWRNFAITCSFWGRNQFGLAIEATLPDDVKLSYGRYIKLFSAQLIVFVLFIISLLGFHLYEAGSDVSQVIPLE